MSYRLSGWIAALLLAARATNNVIGEWQPDPETVPIPADDDAADAGDASAPEVGADAERPLICGKTGHCETKVPRSDLGEPLSLRSVWLVSSADVWSVSAEGFVLHWDGATWTTAYRAPRPLSSVWASATDVWVAGEGGLLLHRAADGAWAYVDPGHAEDIGGIYAASANDIWFGHDTGLEHFDGTTLTTHPVPTAGLYFRTVFGRPGFGAYAAYVSCADCETSGGVSYFVFELVPGEISEFNPTLSKTGLFPVSGVVTDAVDEEHRIFVFGYNRSDKRNSWRHVYNAFGRTTTRKANNIGSPGTLAPLWDATSPTRPIPAWANAGTDVRLQAGIGVSFRWDGDRFTIMPSSIDMGNDFVPRPPYAVHGNATDTWLVGDGFALKGPTQ